jgi:predicted TPR repeat methyltransferase
MLASIEGRHRKHVPDSYIRDVFDQFSDHYESSLLDKLAYRLPAVLLHFMNQSSAASTFGRLLDLGCGTGLVGEVLHPFCDSMTGIDISEKMVSIARKKSIYDALHVAEIIKFVRYEKAAGYDCIVAADVLPYVGDLSELFALLTGIIADQGFFFFSVEALPDGKRLFHLQPCGRFAHSSVYIEAISSAAGWTIMAFEQIDLRREKDGWITGYIYGLTKA